MYICIHICIQYLLQIIHGNNKITVITKVLMRQIQLSALCVLTLGKQVLLFVILSSLQWKSHKEVRKRSYGHTGCM